MKWFGKRGEERGLSTQGPRKSRRGLVAGVVATSLVGGAWTALHVFPDFGPACADGVRAVVGPGPVAWAEDFVYGVEDRIKGLVYRDAPPKTYWEAPTAAPEQPPPAQPAIASNVAVAPTFAPRSFAPPLAEVAGAHDGEWIAVPDPGAPGEPTRMFKAAVHPDAKRPYAVVAIAAIDLTRTDLSLVAGSLEPASADVPPSARPGVVPAERFGDLMAAFNGGFKAQHGHYGMMLDGRTFLPPRDTSCTVALYKDGSLRIGTWPALAASQGDMTGYRQTPPCLVEQGRFPDPLLANGEGRGWGAAVGGETTIRRSGIGLDKDHRTLFYAVGDSVTASSLAVALRAAGAEDAAQLDVNASYPRFVVYARRTGNEAPTVSSALIPDIAYSRHEYVGPAEGRDFFYLTRKPL
jgi:hypothetical protein